MTPFQKEPAERWFGSCGVAQIRLIIQSWRLFVCIYHPQFFFYAFRNLPRFHRLQTQYQHPKLFCFPGNPVQKTQPIYSWGLKM